jgi:hypothetical protein
MTLGRSRAEARSWPERAATLTTRRGDSLDCFSLKANGEGRIDPKRNQVTRFRLPLQTEEAPHDCAH